MNKQGVTRRLFDSGRPAIKNGIFYLDLPGNRETKSIEQRILESGGRVEHFFSKDVTCVVTENRQRRSPRMQKGSQQKPITRAQNILANAKQNQQKSKNGKRNIVTIAEGLGITVLQMEEMHRLLEKCSKVELNNKMKEKEQRGKSDWTEKPATARKLRAPFVKVEDQSRLYQPLIKEMQEWPKLYLESLQPGCPFDPPARASQKGKRSSKGQRSSQSASTQRQKVQVETARATGHFSSSKKAGYCELCNINYRGIKHHLKGKRHLENAANSNAFQELDAEIREGRSPNGYLKSFKQQRTPKKLTIKSHKSPGSPVTPIKEKLGKRGAASSHHVTPLKIVFSPKHGYSVMKVESPRKRKLEVIEIKDDEVIMNTTPKKRKIDDFSVVQLSNLKLKIRRSTRLLRGSSSDHHGSVFLDFPTYRTGVPKEGSSSESEQIWCPKYGDVYGKLRLSTRILDSEDHQGLEEYKCPMYLDASDI